MDFFKNNLFSLLILIISLGSLGLGLYNTQLILKKLNSVVAAGYPDPVTILKKLPTNIPVLGDAKAKLTMIEFGDFQCPYCKQFFDQSFSEIKSKYIDTGKIKFIFVNFAFLGDESVLASEAAMCAQDQNRFWDFYNTLYQNQKGENQGYFIIPKLEQFAVGLKLDSSAFNSCLENHTHKQNVTDQLSLARSYGVTGTPSFFIKSQLIRGLSPLTNLEQALDTNLKN